MNQQNQQMMYITWKRRKERKTPPWTASVLRTTMCTHQPGALAFALVVLAHNAVYSPSEWTVQARRAQKARRRALCVFHSQAGARIAARVATLQYFSGNDAPQSRDEHWMSHRVDVVVTHFSAQKVYIIA